MKLFLRCLLVIIVTALSSICLLPNFYNTENLPINKINLGLDLQGGSHLLLEADFDSYLADQMGNLAFLLKKSLRLNKLGYKNITTNGNVLTFIARDVAEIEGIEKVVRQLNSAIIMSVVEDKITLCFSDAKLADLQDKMVEQSLEIIRARIDSEGTKEPLIQRQGSKYILLQVAGAQNPEQIKQLLGKTAKLSFHLVEDVGYEQQMQTVLKSQQMLLTAKDQPGIAYIVERQAELTGDMLLDAQAIFQNSQPAVSFELNNIGTKMFAELTKNNANKKLAIVLDGKLLSAPTINEPITGGKGVISGNYSVASSSELALLLRAGALPAPLQVIEERSVGPSLGSDSIEQGKKAAIIAISGVMFFMIWIYGIFGLFANIALIASVSYILALIGILGATLTLPGIAGIILTFGMAVDANILIYERIREEKKSGATNLNATRRGFSSAFATIADSNITTLIAALLLYIFGSGLIKGFAVTLSIGILASMFSAIVITKVLIDLWLRLASSKSKINF